MPADEVGRRAAAAVLAAGVLLSGCTAPPAPSPTPTATPSASRPFTVTTTERAAVLGPAAAPTAAGALVAL